MSNAHDAGRTGFLVRLRRAGLVLGGERVLDGVDWELRPGASFALLGPNGSGKTSLLRLARGEVWPSSGRREYSLGSATTPSPLAFRERTSRAGQELWHQYHRRGWDLTGREVAATGFTDSAWLFTPPSAGQWVRVDRVLEELGLAHLAACSILSMSRGQAAGILLARALACDPVALFLDEFTDGLDAALRRRVLAALASRLETGMALVAATHRPGELLGLVESALVLEAGRLVRRGALEQVWQAGPSGGPTARRQDPDPARTASRPGRDESPAPQEAPSPLVEVRGARVALGGRTVLFGLNWRIAPGERWAVVGANGSGKTTLVRLVLGEVAPLAGGEVVRFGSMSVRRAVKRMGHVSPGLQAAHRYAQTGLEVAASGFWAGVGPWRDPEAWQLDRAWEWMRRLGVEELAHRDVSAMSCGQLRRLLLVRAVVADPWLLLLDEPCAGLDAESRAGVLGMIDWLSRTGMGLVYVTHRPREIGFDLDAVLVLDQGRVVCRGGPGACL